MGAYLLLPNGGQRLNAIFDIPPEAFIPPPKITSTVVRIIPRAKPLAELQEPADLEAVTAIAFGKRRKMLRASFKASWRGRFYRGSRD